MDRMTPLLAFLLCFCSSGSVGELTLNSSPRHHEWVEIDGVDRKISTFVVYPEASVRTPVVLLIHENRGLTDWVRALADQVAAEGYIAVAPDLLSGMAPNGGMTSDFPDRNSARDALYTLTDPQVMAELEAVATYAESLSASNEKLAVAGFCWGGRRAFQFAGASDAADAVFVFYGTPADEETIASIEMPVYGFYGESDARVTSTVDATVESMASAGKTYVPVIYPGAGHGFMRSGEGAGADPANVAARAAAWDRWMSLLAELR